MDGAQWSVFMGFFAVYGRIELGFDLPGRQLPGIQIMAWAESLRVPRGQLFAKPATHLRSGKTQRAAKRHVDWKEEMNPKHEQKTIIQTHSLHLVGEEHTADDGDLTHLLRRWSQGDDSARNTLARRVLPDLRRLAGRQLSFERRNHTLQATALVNEAFSKLLGQRSLSFECRGQFFAFSAELMRRVLVDHAKKHLAKKRGSGEKPLPLEEAFGFAAEKSDELIRLDQALQDLAKFNPEGARVVELRYFVGLKHAEVAEVLGMSHTSARRLWTEARAWLYLQLGPEAVGGSE